LYPGKDKASSKLIILVPGLGTTRDAYPLDFISSLHDAVPDAMILAIDPKGHGKSSNLGSWRDFDYSLFLDMRNDITAAKPYIVSKYPTVKQIYVVGASMGSTSALLAGVKEKYITKVVMISPGIAFNNVDITAPGALDSYSQQLLVVASSGDSYSSNSAYEISSLTSKSQTTMKIYPGSAHGTDLFSGTKGDDTPLSNLLIDFLSK
jgi:pimeloyl-ACP methyl ester carboxylesterase